VSLQYEVNEGVPHLPRGEVPLADQHSFGLEAYLAGKVDPQQADFKVLAKILR
jgi:hypothetical protein